ncbi:branched-chain amino acid ABC transporter permease [Bradyrhizobium sp. NP1]|uniref:branched-chain amino acid ABC transporter permease n=1 Tax=Bradyrhizobium sp. NP1 TaxID=3049772 RepID=UPI0025A52606|nr:branched-chain amino acid ABC transporter permease [Bradyrhizobium sp. NP1]WJR77435.1 branched-chain amino acid ABC transporter permease [Bradyrhizobium sp. NP1]
MSSSALIAQIGINGLSLGAIYILVALGFTLIFGIMRIVNFAHGEFAMLGGFATLFWFTTLGLPFLPALAAGAITVGASGLVLERVVYRHFYQREMPGMIATLGLSVALTSSGVWLWGPYQRSIPSAFTDICSFGSVVISQDRVVVVLVAAVTLCLFWALLQFSRIGLAMRAVAQDIEIAEAQGMDTRLVYRTAFFVATVMAALAGGLLSQLYALSPFIGQMPLTKGFIVVILGGLGSIPGAALGGLLLGMSESILSTLYGASIAQFASFGGIILLLLWRPNGLLGRFGRA